MRMTASRRIPAAHVSSPSARKRPFTAVDLMPGNERPAFLEQIRQVRDVPRDKYPLLVTFTDIADPKTVTKVDPDNLAATFGPGVALKRITLEITDEKVTEGRTARCSRSGCRR
jgi:hypothetical protein